MRPASSVARSSTARWSRNAHSGCRTAGLARSTQDSQRRAAACLYTDIAMRSPSRSEVRILSCTGRPRLPVAAVACRSARIIHGSTATSRERGKLAVAIRHVRIQSVCAVEISCRPQLEDALPGLAQPLHAPWFCDRECECIAIRIGGAQHGAYWPSSGTDANAACATGGAPSVPRLHSRPSNPRRCPRIPRVRACLQKNGKKSRAMAEYRAPRRFLMCAAEQLFLADTRLLDDAA